MSPAAIELLAQALCLSEEEREWVAAEISDSLLPPMTAEQETAILELLEDRRSNYLSGRVELHPAEEVSARAWAILSDLRAHASDSKSSS